MTERGFTLLEVVVALTILAVSLPSLFGMLTDGLRRSDDAKRQAEAGALAQSLMAAVGRGSPMQNGHTQGTAPSGYRWRISVAPYDYDQDSLPVTAHAVHIEVQWTSRGRDRSLSLDSLRLAVGGRAW